MLENGKAFRLRLKHEYEMLQKQPANDLFCYEPAPGEEVPYVSRYRVTYTVPTWVMTPEGELTLQDRTVVEMELTSLSSPPRARVVEGLAPFHPNCYTWGLVDSGSWSWTFCWLFEYMIYVCEVLQFKEKNIDPNSPSNNWARDYWLQHKDDPGRFPTDTRPVPEMVTGDGSTPKIRIIDRKRD